MCKLFKLKELSLDICQTLIFVQNLTAKNDVEIRARILTNLEQGVHNLILEIVVEEYQRIISL